MDADARPAASRSRWTSFVAHPKQARPRMLCEERNPAHRLRVEHDDSTLLVHLSDEDGAGWTVLAVDRPTRRWVVSQARRQIDAAQDAYSRLRGSDAPPTQEPLPLPDDAGASPRLAA